MTTRVKHDPQMTEKQYKTLRRLVSLWFLVVVRRKYTIFQNLVLILSVCANIYLVFFRSTAEPAMASGLMSKSVNVQQALDLSNYASTSDPGKTLLSRYTKIYKRYLEDKSNPDHSYFTKNGRVDPSWYSHCRKQLLKIINIRNKLRAVEGILQKSYPEKSDEIDAASNRSEETLADMSNYYSKFIPTEVYDSIIKNYD